MAPPRCPYCFTALDGNEREVACRRCGTPHHFACWSEHGRCVILGCGERKAQRSRVDARRALAVVVGPERHPFLIREGRQFGEPRWLEVERLDHEPSYRGRAKLELRVQGGDETRRGDEVVSTVSVHLEESLLLRGLRLGLKTESVRAHSIVPETILEREAVIMGHPWEGYFVALQVAWKSLVNDDSALVRLPAGVSRFLTRFRVDEAHPLREEGRAILSEVYVYADIPAATDLIARAPILVRAAR